MTSEGGPRVPPGPRLPGPLSGTHGLRAHAPHVDTGAQTLLFAKLVVISVIIHIMYLNQIHKGDFRNAT